MKLSRKLRACQGLIRRWNWACIGCKLSLNVSFLKVSPTRAAAPVVHKSVFTTLFSLMPAWTKVHTCLLLPAMCASHLRHPSCLSILTLTKTCCNPDLMPSFLEYVSAFHLRHHSYPSTSTWTKTCCNPSAHLLQPLSTHPPALLSSCWPCCRYVLSS
jgi:hypothetical protein